ncbi:MAG: hypothetical protein KBA31_19615 [Alphaproteobacteria bacterium]|nr:hypothetical protein [Alphaproteobacteria bacterium]
MPVFGVAAVLGASVVTPVAPGPPAFTARYEAPIYGANGEHAAEFDLFGARWFDFWRGRSGFARIPGPTEAKACDRPDLHFCIKLAELTFSAPKQGTKPGATWTVGDNVQFRLMAVGRVRFRDSVITVHTIKADHSFVPAGQTILSDVFSYSYEWGVIGYANLFAENYDHRNAASPRVLNSTYVLASEHGLGGRENCKYWKCSLP